MKKDEMEETLNDRLNLFLRRYCIVCHERTIARITVVRCLVRNEGRPLGTALQEEVSNRGMRL
jgi:hypothetical protein